MHSKQLTFAVVLLAAAIAVPSGAIDLPGVGKRVLPGEDAKETSQPESGASAEVAQVQIVKDFDGALSSLIQAQVLLRQAFNIADESAAKEADAATLGLEDCEDKDCLDAKIGMSERNQVEIDKVLEEGRELDDRGKQHYAEALPLYAGGTIDMGRLVPEVGRWSKKAQEEIKDAGLRNARRVRQKLEVGTYIARRAPAIAKTFAGATKAVVTYGNAKQLDTSAANDVEF